MRARLDVLRSPLFLAGFSVSILLLVRVDGLVAPVAKEGLRSFVRVRLREEKCETSAGVDVSDLNGDGLLGIVLGKGRHWPSFNRVLLNDGQGGFRASNQESAPDRTYSAALADLNRDGSLGIVVSKDSPDRRIVYLNDGQGDCVRAGLRGV
ncbi:MAG: VCBS repeat-containing protein [Paludibaculum sp.]